MEWNAIAALAQIAGAIATVAAVIVALMLGRRQTAERLSVRTGTRRILALPMSGERSSYNDEQVFLTVTVTNYGMVPVHLAGIAWRAARREPELDIAPGYGGSTSATVEPGKTEEYGYRLDREGHLVDSSTPAARLYPTPLIKPKFVRVSTERGQHFMTRFPPRWRPLWYSRLRHLPPSTVYELRRVDSGGGMTTTFPESFPPKP